MLLRREVTIMSKLIPAGLILLMASACTVGPDYVRPQVTAPATWNVSYDAATGLTDYAWWQQFNDPVIDDLISIALTNNLDLKVAVARVDQFLGQLRTTRSEYFPRNSAAWLMTPCLPSRKTRSYESSLGFGPSTRPG